MPPTLNNGIFREYDIRGNADRDLPSPVAEAIGKSVAAFVSKRGGKTLALGRDCRLSSPRLREAILKGFIESGINVIDVGLVPTPLLYFAVCTLKVDGGIM